MNEYITLPSVITAIGAILVTIGAFWSSIESSKQNAANAEKQLAFHQELKEKDEEIIRKGHQIEELNQVIAQSITGGDSFPSCLPMFKSADKLTLFLNNRGEYPIYNLQVTLFDQDLFSEKLSKYGDDHKEISKVIGSVHSSCQKLLNFGDIGPSQGIEIASIDLDTAKKERNLMINYLALNGATIQLMKLRWVNNHWSIAYKVENKNGIVEEQIGKDFPKDQLWK